LRHRRTTDSAPVGWRPDPTTTPKRSSKCTRSLLGLAGLLRVPHLDRSENRPGEAYTIYEVIDWRLRGSGSAVAIRKRARPMQRWRQRARDPANSAPTAWTR